MNKILIVDDDKRLNKTINEVLERSGYSTCMVYSGDEAIDKISTDRFDIALLDLIMPGMKGVDVLTEVRRISPKTKVIMITAFATIESAIDAIRKGASEYISKPFKINELLTIIERVFEESRFEDNIGKIDIDYTLSSLSNAIRRNIITLLHSQTKLRFMDIVRQLGVEDSRKIVFHLKILREANLIRQNKEKLYVLTEEGKITFNSLKIFENYLTSK
ncbi:response regulator receiver protein [Candidatus Omnitrophus magneticus]|uniref:Response regulator receiver protein n=1 Tax=Candidatus Omnitrophus magneticus TaxID=1609969 RepID=A0A0F0CR63_9BACT|nr:response regulator receiver protein [Candidatus Omnitrophus magneticus]